MLSPVSHEGEANQDHTGLPRRPLDEQTVTSPNADKGVEKVCLSFVSGGDMKWESHSGKQFGGVSQN